LKLNTKYAEIKHTCGTQYQKLMYMYDV